MQHPCNTTRVDVSNSFNVGKALINLACSTSVTPLRETGRSAEAKKLEARAKAIRAKHAGESSIAPAAWNLSSPIAGFRLWLT